MSTTTSSIILPDVARQEGWTLSDCGTHPDGSPMVQLQRLDTQQSELPSFADDRDAWEFVVTQARAGSVPHREALQQVDDVERFLIEAACGSW